MISQIYCHRPSALSTSLRLGEDRTHLRFSLVDNGISPTAKLDNLVHAEPPFMADRPRALIDPMEDLNYVRREGELVLAS